MTEGLIGFLAVLGFLGFLFWLMAWSGKKAG